MSNSDSEDERILSRLINADNPQADYVKPTETRSNAKAKKSLTPKQIENLQRMRERKQQKTQEKKQQETRNKQKEEMFDMFKEFMHSYTQKPLKSENVDTKLHEVHETISHNIEKPLRKPKTSNKRLTRPKDPEVPPPKEDVYDPFDAIFS